MAIVVELVAIITIIGEFVLLAEMQGGDGKEKKEFVISEIESILESKEGIYISHPLLRKGVAVGIKFGISRLIDMVVSMFNSSDTFTAIFGEINLPGKSGS